MGTVGPSRFREGVQMWYFRWESHEFLGHVEGVRLHFQNLGSVFKGLGDPLGSERVFKCGISGVKVMICLAHV